jgi:hypothetical protein
MDEHEGICQRGVYSITKNLNRLTVSYLNLLHELRKYDVNGREKRPSRHSTSRLSANRKTTSLRNLPHVHHHLLRVDF